MSLENTPPTTPPNPFQPGAMPPAPTPPAPAGTAPVQATLYAAPVAPFQSGPPPAQGPTVSNAFSTIPARAWRGAVASAGIAYGAAFIVGLITVALTGLLTGWEMFSPGWLVSGPAQLVALATFGRLGVSAEVDFFVSFAGSVSIGVLPILVLAALLAGTYASSRFVGRGVWHGPSALILSAVSGLTLAIGVTVLAAVLPVELPDLQLGSPLGAASAASVGSFFGALVVGFGVSYLARLQATSGWSHLLIRATWVPWGTVRIAALHLGTLVAVSAVVLAVALPLAGTDGIGGALPALLLTIAINAVVIGMMGAFSADLSDVQRLLSSLGGTSDESTQLSITVFTDGITGYVWLLVLLAVLVAVVASLLIAVRRNRVLPSPTSWLATISTYTVIGLTLQVLGSAMISASMTSPSNASAGGSFGPAAWTFLIFAVWGAAVEALARFVAPVLLAYATPAVIRTLVTLSGQERLLPAVMTAPLVPVAVGAVADGIAPPAPIAAGQLGTAPTPFATNTLPPATAKRVKVGAIIVGAAALLIIAASVAGGIVRSSVFGPQNVATSYLGALEDGNATTALKLLGSSIDSGDGMLSNDAFGRATDRIEDATITEVSIDGDVAQIEVKFRQGESSDTAMLELTRTSTDWLIVDHWSILNAEPGQFDVYTPTSLGTVELQANGSSVGNTDGAGFPLVAFPGTYEMTIPATDYFEESSMSYTVSGLLGGDEQYASSEGEFTAVPTDKYESTAIDLVNALIASCVASTEAELNDCPTPDAGYTSSNYDITNVVYTLVTPPVLSVELGFEDGGLIVSSEESGTANVAYDITWSFSTDPTHQSGERNFSVYAEVNVVDDEVVVTAVR